MNKVEIKVDDKLVFHASGDYWEARDKSGYLLASSVNTCEPEPDRITITLTEREAELVSALSDSARATGHTDALWGALRAVNVCVQVYAYFDFDGFPRNQQFGDSRAYAFAERIPRLSDPDYALTMDRDVAVTLIELLDRVECRGECELDPIEHKLKLQGISHAKHPRFTGTIRWKKKRLCSTDCEIGKTYRRVETSPYEQVMWEEA